MRGMRGELRGGGDEVAVLVFEALRALVGDAQVEGLVGARRAERAGALERRGGWRGEAARRRVLFAHGGRSARAHRARAPPTCNKPTHILKPLV